MGDRRGWSLRVALGHCAVVRKYNEVISEPHKSPSHQQHQRKRSSLSADTTVLEELQLTPTDAAVIPSSFPAEDRGGGGTISLAVHTFNATQSSLDSPQGTFTPVGLASSHSIDSTTSSSAWSLEGTEGQLPGSLSPLNDKENDEERRDHYPPGSEPAAVSREVPSLLYDSGMATEEVSGGAADGADGSIARRGPDDMEVQSNEDRESAIVAERMLAQHYVADRPELKRYDSADAVIQKLREGQLQRQQQKGGGEEEGGAQQAGAEGGVPEYKGLGEMVQPGTIPSPLRTESSGYASTDSERGTPSPPQTLHQAYPQPLPGGPTGAGRFVEITCSPVSSPAHHATGHSTLCKELDEFGPLRPMLTHFDSADYYMQEKHAQEGGQGGGGFNNNQCSNPLMASEIRALEAWMQQRGAPEDDGEFLPTPFGLKHFDSADHFMEEEKNGTNVEGFEKQGNKEEHTMNGFQLGSSLQQDEVKEEQTSIQLGGHKAAASFFFKRGGKQG